VQVLDRFADLESTLAQMKLDPAENAPLLAPLLDIPLPQERAPTLARVAPPAIGGTDGFGDGQCAGSASGSRVARRIRQRRRTAVAPTAIGCSGTRSQNITVR
jgi:hypothetical protein